MRYLQIIREEELLFTTVIFKCFTPCFKLTKIKCNGERAQSKKEYLNEVINAGEIETWTKRSTFKGMSNFSSLLYCINNMGVCGCTT